MPRTRWGRAVPHFYADFPARAVLNCSLRGVLWFLSIPRGRCVICAPGIGNDAVIGVGRRIRPALDMR